MGTADELEALKFTLQLLERPFGEALTQDCEATLWALRDRLLARKKEDEEAKALREEMDAQREAALKGDDITYDERGDPDTLPF